MSQEALAKQVGITRKHLTQIETGRSLPSYELQSRLAEKLGPPVWDLFPRTEDEAGVTDRLAEADEVMARTGGGCS